jgi:pimeloyl-ACP methyl ester carboxylesterase
VKRVKPRIAFCASLIAFLLGAACSARVQDSQQKAPPASTPSGVPSQAQAKTGVEPSPGKTEMVPAPTKPPDIVIGFVGGYVSGSNMHHAEVQLAARLKAAYPIGVYVEAFANRHYKTADKTILNLLDINQDGNLTQEEKNKARIILYGHSWGAAAAVMLARELQSQQIPVLLTIQVDSVNKFGWVDKVIPSNVAQAANFYQTHGSLSGLKEIKAEDPSKTKILGNYLFDYSKDPIVCKGYPWWDRYFARAHTEIECDPKVWTQVEDLVRQVLPPVEKKPGTVTEPPKEEPSTLKPNNSKKPK